MIRLTEIQAVMVGVLLAAVLVVGLALLFVGTRRLRMGTALIGENARQQAFLDSSPALVMIVRSDSRVDSSPTLGLWLGLVDQPATIDDLATADAGLDEDDFRIFSDAVTAARRAGAPFRLSLRVKRGARSLLAVGQRAPDRLNAPGGVLIWMFDASELQSRAARLGEEAEELRAAFTSLTALIEAAPMPMWYRNRELRLAMVNTAYVHAVDAANHAQVIDQQIELIEGSGMGGPLANAAIARDTGHPQTAAVPAIIKGERRMLRIHDLPLFDGGAAGFAVDIEELEQARGGLKRFADAQRAMLDRLSAGVAQFAADRSLIFCNQPFRRMFAMRPEWLADRPEFDRVLERMRESSRLPEVRDFPGWKAERREWFHAQSPEIEESWHLPGGIHLRVVAQPLPEGGLLIIFEDRTEQVQLASARDTLLRVRTAMFDNLFESLGVFASDGRLQLWNEKFRRVWDFDEDLLARHPRIDALVKAGEARLSDPRQTALISELVRSATVERKQRGGRIAFTDGRHFELTAVPLPDGNALFTMLDISDSKRIEQALRDRNEALETADRVKSAFVANMSYELRTPLTSIKGFTEMLHGGYAGQLSAAGTGYAEAILQSVTRLSTLIDDVLDLTEGDEEIPREPVDLEHIAGAAAETLAPIAAERGVVLALDVHGSAGTVRGDPRRIRQAIEHLLRFSINGLGPGGRLLLHVDGDADSARIIVSDDGPGMSQEAANHAFDRFASSAIVGPGSDPALGLGLPLAKRFVEAHGGTVTMLSQPGEGMLMTIGLPRG
ncbi:PAS domain-containing sensor histidine kinase [Stakelama pacifica]|uniref:histidine kinase n=1 Tax=Stakelama pacifica TaxID=517720 RepID=A0A4R6FHJ5_9SPHN|nr:PAS domain-containing sensor histidine kinase [Stakelama pacifica]TDN79944.1 PAS/PAC sensor signal transduction histidine kinase [Stakelama pacifica]GGO98289.1 two-component sensor histidine kinase [Stakelama pacifica]